MANVVITGSNSGFGLLTARTLLEAGHTVFATMRSTTAMNANAAREFAELGIHHGGRGHVVDLDVTSDASVQSAIASIAQRCDGAIDVVFNNAGRYSAGILEAYTVDEIKALFEVNVFGPLRVNRAVLPYMRRQRSGLIIATSSVVGRYSLPAIAPYSASKFALEAFAEAQRDELKSLGIDVVLLQAGAFPTQLASKRLQIDDQSLSAEYAGVADVPRRMGERLAHWFRGPAASNPQGVADAVAQLIAMPAGQRPLRLVVDSMTGDCMRSLNDVQGAQRTIVMQSLGVNPPTSPPSPSALDR